MHRIDGPGATVDGKFTEGDPVGGIQATVVTDDFLNDVQEELISILAAAGVPPVKGTQDQLLESIYKLVQVQKATAFTTGGSATALTLTPIPAISAYAVNQRFSVKFHVNSGANPTINASGKGAKPLKQYAATGEKIPAVFFEEQISDVVYDGEDFIVLSATAGSGGLKYRSMVYMSTSSPISASAHAGSIVIGLSNTPISAQLPLANTFTEASTVTFFNYFNGPMTLVCAGSDGIVASNTTPTMVLTKGMSVTLVSNNGTSWFVVGSSSVTNGIRGGFSELLGSAAGVSASATWTVKEIEVMSGAGAYKTIRNVSISPSLAAAGVNGLDTSTRAPSQWYYAYIIWNESTDARAGIFSLSPQSPSVMPAGYTHSARVGSVRTDATGNVFIFPFTQSGNEITWAPAPGTNLTAYFPVAFGLGGSLSAGGLVAAAVSNFVPATSGQMTVSAYNTGGTTAVAATNTHTAISDPNNPPPIIANPAGASFSSAVQGRIQLRSNNIFWTANGANAKISALGYTDNL